ncbi:hypothetical protein L7F22_021505 [Adiantum nelumboides]|nr:hypothetical protein [Adiantum nelumboides]
MYNTKLGDFGLARQLQGSMEGHTTLAAGTVGYMAPETYGTGSEKLEIETPSKWDIEGNKHYILDLTLSNEYLIKHLGDCLYISDTEESDCPLQQSEGNASLSFKGTPHEKEDCPELGSKSFDMVSNEDE